MKLLVTKIFAIITLIILPITFISTTQGTDDAHDYVLNFPSERYPETAQHIKESIEKGHPDVCTIDRKGADDRRKQSLKGIPTKKGYDRDEYPMAMCEEGGEGADVKYISPSDNRGAGSWVGHQVSGYSDGTKVLFIVD
ncbi:hypothetical protein [Bacillus phage SPO1L3]|nr:sporulation-specific extracellular nuclease [Bacillus phage vB_BsuM-Goe9]WIT26387.1 hypothetical protein [Bacillus phage SPO1L3]